MNDGSTSEGRSAPESAEPLKGLDRHLDAIEKKIDSKPGVLGVIGTMCAVVAAPFSLGALWFSSEIGHLTSEVEKAAEASSAAAANASIAAVSSGSVENQLDDLVKAIAVREASVDHPDKNQLLSNALPNDLFLQLVASGKLTTISYSNFQTHWVVVDQSDLNFFPSSFQRDMLESLERYGVRVIVDRR